MKYLIAFIFVTFPFFTFNTQAQENCVRTVQTANNTTIYNDCSKSIVVKFFDDNRYRRGGLNQIFANDSVIVGKFEGVAVFAACWFPRSPAFFDSKNDKKFECR